MVIRPKPKNQTKKTTIFWGEDRGIKISPYEYLGERGNDFIGSLYPDSRYAQDVHNQFCSQHNQA